MERVAVADVTPADLGADGRRWRLADALGADAVAVNRYEVPPGGGLPGGLHAHPDQEEVFVVLSGEATFQTFRGVLRVAAGEAIRFAPGEFQSGRNDGESDMAVLAVGAPRESEDTRVPVACPDCARPDLRLSFGDRLTFVCPDCAGEFVPETCPACGDDDLRVTLADRGSPSDDEGTGYDEQERAGGGEGRPDTEVVCRDCGARFDTAPLEAA